MKSTQFTTIERLLASQAPDDIQRGLVLAREEAAKLYPQEAEPLLEIVSTLFYVDALDRPDLVPMLDQAISLVASFGKGIIPMLLRHMEAGDVKAQLAIGQALGRMGAEAVAPLVREYQEGCSQPCRSFILYALGHVQSSEVVRAAPLAIEAASSDDQELRDTAMRAIGKFAESIPPSRMPVEVRDGFVAKCQERLSDANPAIRAKAVRSLGKLARHGHLRAQELEQLRATLCRILGEDEQFDWDRAYVVRREAKEAQEFLQTAPV